MNTAVLSLTLAAFASLAVVGTSAGRAEGSRPCGHPPGPLFRVLDLNGDGALGAEEMARANSSLKALDLNGDGVVGPEEFMPPPPPDSTEEGAPPPPPPDPLFAALDLDRDGELDGAELAAAPQSLLPLDANGDGVLSPEELRPAKPRCGAQAG